MYNIISFLPRENFLIFVSRVIWTVRHRKSLRLPPRPRTSTILSTTLPLSRERLADPRVAYRVHNNILHYMCVYRVLDKSICRASVIISYTYLYMYTLSRARVLRHFTLEPCGIERNTFSLPRARCQICAGRIEFTAAVENTGCGSRETLSLFKRAQPQRM